MVKVCPKCHKKNAAGNTLCCGCACQLIFVKGTAERAEKQFKVQPQMEQFFFTMVNVAILIGLYYGVSAIF